MAAAVSTDDLTLTDAQAKKVVNLAIEHGAYSDEMPDNKKARIEAATEAIEYCIDSWVNDGVRPDDKDDDIAAAGEAILTIFEAAGIEVDEDGDIVMPGEESGDEDEGEADDGEAPFDPDDYIEGGYTELTPASKIKKLEELDLEDEETANVVQAIREWENEQDKPSSRVLSWIDENLGEEADAEPADDDDNEGDGEGEEPWDGYDKSSAVDIKKFLDEAAANEDDPLTVEQLEYVKSYEEGLKNPRKRVLDKVDELITAIEEGGEEPEEEPKKKGGALAKKTKASASKSSGDDNGVIVLTREQILTALDSGEVTIEI